MAKFTLHPQIQGLSGKHGDLVFYQRNGQQYARIYKKPKDSKTASQMASRNIFSEAVESWKKLHSDEKNLYRKKAKNLRMSGYNLFISEFIKKKRNKQLQVS